MPARVLSLFWRVFAVNAGLLALIAILLIASPVTISAPIKLTQALLIVVALAVAVAANAFLLRRAFKPLERLAERMDMVDLLRPGQRLRVARNDEVGRVVHAFNKMLDRLESERQQSGRRVLAAQEAERVGIARDLHDEVGQVLTGVLFQLDSIASAAPEHREDLEEAKSTVRRALDEVRRISSELRPEMLEHLGLVSALTELTSTFGRVSNVQIERRFDPALPKLTAETELAVYRIAQESLTNIARHAQATRVTITLERGTDSIVLRVADDGRGFDGKPEEHGGLRSMRERALLIEGALAFKPAPGGGVEVRLEVPVVTRILIADDFPIVRSGLRKVLDAKPDLEVVAEAEDGHEAVEKAIAEDVDLVILDISMPRMTGIQAAGELQKRKPEIKVLILSMHDSEQFLFEALKAGASGYVLKSGADTDIVDAVRAAMRGETFLYPSAVTSLVRDYVERGGRGEEQFDVLTPRELEVLKLIAEAYTSKQIAAALFISIKTVERHRQNILDKLGMRDRVELTRYAIRRGLIQP
jgi:two-component system, NarL family, sensor histidine kinase UhpB